MPSRRVLVAASLLLAASWAGAPAACAHALLDHAEPRVGGSVSAAPAEVTLFFTQAVEPAFASVAVTDASGAEVDRGDVRVDPGDGAVVRVSLRPLPPGTYQVRWRVVSVDTHPSEGTFTFHVAP
jgi:methionine-rich copper-binding protein CopC